MSKKIRMFFIEDHGETIDDAYEHAVSQFGDDEDLTWAATQFAEHYHSEHDGWEATWPIVFTVADMNKNILGKVSVERESEPVFYGHKVKESPNA